MELTDPRCAHCGCGLYGSDTDEEFCEGCRPEEPDEESEADGDCWRTSKKGNPWRLYLDFAVTVFPSRRGGWPSSGLSTRWAETGPG
jgi:hypothetical protein